MLLVCLLNLTLVGFGGFKEEGDGCPLLVAFIAFVVEGDLDTCSAELPSVAITLAIAVVVVVVVATPPEVALGPLKIELLGKMGPIIFPTFVHSFLFGLVDGVREGLDTL